jgi:hypothetical protein
MGHLLCSIFLILIGHFTFAEIGWVGDPNFEARGCKMMPGEKLTLAQFPICQNKVLCSGKMNCYFIHKDKLSTNLNWIQLTNSLQPGIDTWILADAPALCLPKNGSCDNMNFTDCANMRPEKIGCSFTDIASPSFQAIPKKQENVK